MRRIERVEAAIVSINQRTQKGVTADEVAQAMNCERSNISRDLNKLVSLGRCIKKKNRPVLFYPVEVKHKEKVVTSVPVQMKSEDTYFDHFSKLNPSLFHQIELGKAAILYPSHTMHVLLLGETGVGKSMFAELLHEYGKEAKKFQQDSPFIQFNCADYANNPQLLMAHLFGSVKGAYTGADKEREGLLKQADNGILFLDEIHRLPIEGQEMLFTYMDKGTFQPLGETEKHISAKVMLIGATTERQDSLLSTFIRRLPIIIELPNLAERSIEERFQLFDHFTQAEVDKLGISVEVSTNTIKCFLSYSCKNNIGQFKTDIRIVFAKAYADYLTGKKEVIVITTKDLPDYIHEGLLSGVEHRKMWSVLDIYNNQFYKYQPTSKKEIDRTKFSIYEEINQIYLRLENKNLSIKDIQVEMEHDLKEYLKKHDSKKEEMPTSDNLVSLISESLLQVIEAMIEYCEEMLNEKLSRKVHQALAIHVYNIVERIQNNQTIQYEKDYSFSKKYPHEFQIAIKAIVYLENKLNISIPKEEANYLVLFFSYDDLNDQVNQENVKVIVIAHGKNTATALSDTANSLLRNNDVVGINARLDEKPQEVYNQLKDYVRKSNITKDILLLVDMGSLLTFSENLEKDFGMKSKAIPLVSTMHVLEASRKAMLGYTLEEIFQETLKVNNYLDSILEQTEDKLPTLLDLDGAEVKSTKPLVILSVCMTGEGTALTIKEMLEFKLNLSDKEIEIIPLNFVGKDSIYSQILNYEKMYRIVCIVSTFHIETGIPNYDLYDIMNEKGIEDIEKNIQEEVTYRSMAKTIKKYFDIPDIDSIISKLFTFNDKIELLLNTRFNSSELIGLSFHIIGMVLKNQKGEEISPFIDRENVLKNNIKFVNRIQQEFTQDFSEYFIDLTENELNYVGYSYLNIRKEKN